MKRGGNTVKQKDDKGSVNKPRSGAASSNAHGPRLSAVTDFILNQIEAQNDYSTHSAQIFRISHQLYK